MRPQLFAFVGAAAALAATGAFPATLTNPDAITVTTPAGTNNPSPDPTSGTLVDDTILDSLSFGSTTFSAGSSSFAAAQAVEVTGDRTLINAEFGDADDSSDGDDNPFAKAGEVGQDQTPDLTLQETTDPAVQDELLRNVFNSLSITEMNDGEGGPGYGFNLLFENGLTDDAPGDAVDGTPEIVLFERGMNDEFDLRPIVGGTFGTPVFGAAVTVNSADFFATGYAVNTREIGNGQPLGVGGLDLDEFGLTAGETVFGLEITSDDGPDLSGLFLGAEDGSRFVDPLPMSPVPLPAPLLLLLAGLGGLGLLRRTTRDPAAA